MLDIDKLNYDAAGLIPAIAQDCVNGRVLMLAYMNKESLAKTLETGEAHYFSRSRQALWRKGETSGHTQRVLSVTYDCDADALLLAVEQTGPACHTGETSCFHNTVYGDKGKSEHVNAFEKVFSVIAGRRSNPKEGSYTNYLFNEGIDKICKKVGEEAAETIIAAKNNDKDELVYEVSDLIYHLSVLLANRGADWGDISKELINRMK